MSELLNDLFFLAVPILMAVTVHEVAHGWAAYKLGDDTAKMLGRLSLNPIKHLDLVGTLAFIVTKTVGWAKPVPVNPYNLRRPKQDMIWVSAAGPAANMILAGLFGLCWHMLGVLQGFVPQPGITMLAMVIQYGVIINLGLAIFNLLPIPPLDGSGILAGLLPPEMARSYEQIRPYGFIILLVLIFTGAVDKIIVPVIQFLAVAIIRPY